MDVELYTNKLIKFSSSVIKQLTSPEAHAALEYFYNINMYGHLDQTSEMFNSVIYRKEEAIHHHILYKQLLLEYMTYEFNKNYNMSLDDFLNLTFFEKNKMIEVVKEKEKIVSEHLEKYKNKTDINLSKLDSTDLE